MNRRLTIIILLILTVLVAGAAVFIGYQLQRQNNTTPDPSKAGAVGPGGRGYYTNVCGDSAGNVYNANGGCFVQCNLSTGQCSGGAWGVLWYCPGGPVQECKSGETPDRMGLDTGAACGQTLQLDIFNKVCRVNGGWNCGNGDLLGYLVWYTGDCVTNPPPPPPPSGNVQCGQCCYGSGTWRNDGNNGDCDSPTQTRGCAAGLICDYETGACTQQDNDTFPVCSVNPPPPPPPPTATPTPTRTPTPTPTTPPAGCGLPCNPSQGAQACQNDSLHSCISWNGSNRCVLDSCSANPGSCYSDGCTPVPNCGQVCDPNEANPCSSQNHQCVQRDGQFRCVIDQCVNDPASCDSLGCNLLGSLVIEKTAAESCSVDSNSSTVTYTIRVTNNDSSQRTVTVTDTPDPDIIQFIQAGTISNGGTLSNGNIIWANVNVPANSSITFTYQAVVLKANFGTIFANTVVLTENGVERGRDTAEVEVDCIPDTALINDTADRILIGMFMIIVGIIIYRFKLYFTAYNWINGRLGNEAVTGNSNKMRDSFDDRLRD